MASYVIRYYLYRSNPIVLREIKIPDWTNVTDILAALCLAAGIPEQKGEFWYEERRVSSGIISIAEIFERDGKLVPAGGFATIYQDEKTREAASLTFRYEVMEKTEENLECPEIVRGAGYCLPQKVFVIGTVNEILQAFEEKTDITIQGVGTFMEGQHNFQLKKIQNYLYSYFMPEKAAVIKSELAAPLKNILENRTMTDLKWLAEIYHCYPYHKRKDDYIGLLVQELSEQNIDNIFDEMDIIEYQNFKTLVTTGKTSCKDNDMVFGMFPVLNRYGMISVTKKMGPLLAAPLLLDYEQWFDQEKEKHYCIGKRISLVMHGCAFYYGVFTKKRCEEVLNALYPGEVSKEVLDLYWRKPPHEREKALLYKLNQEDNIPFAYEHGMFSEDTARMYYKALSIEADKYYLPGKEELEKSARNNGYRGLKLYQILERHISMNYYYYDFNADAAIMYVINTLRKGNTAEEAVEIFLNKMGCGWRISESRREELRDMISKEGKEIPNILYYGFSPNKIQKKGITSKAIDELHRLEELKKEEEARKKAARKKTTTKGRRYR